MPTAIMIFVGLICAGVIACTVADCWRAYRRPTRKVSADFLMAILREVIEDAEGRSGKRYGRGSGWRDDVP